MTNPIPSKKRRKDPEVLLCILLLIAILFEATVTGTLLVRSATPSAGENIPTGEAPTDAPTDEPTPNMPNAPIVNNATVDLTEASAVTSKYVLLMNADTWEVLAEKNADERFSPASMTKVMTLLVAVEALSAEDMNQNVVLSQEVVNYISKGDYAGTSVSLPQKSNGISCIGDYYKLKDLLYGIGVSSAADCTYMVVKEIAGTEEAFVAMMNEKAAELGLENTHFNNAVGFESADNYTNAKDMATIMAYAMENELVADILKMRTENLTIKAYWMKNGVETSYSVSLKPSINSRLDKYPSFALDALTLEATKTGYTSQSYIVCSAKAANGTRYVLVLGEADNPKENLTGQFRDTMIDVEHIYNQYVK